LHTSMKHKPATILAILFFSLSISMLPAACSKHISGVKVKDNFIEDFFRPEIAYKSLKIIDTKEGKRYVVIDFGRKLEKEELKQYQITLAKRGFSEYKAEVHTPGSYYIDLLRKLSGEPSYSEYSMLMYKSASKGALDISRNDINRTSAKIQRAVHLYGGHKTRIAIEITRDFGHKWTKVQIMPDTDVKGVDPRIGRYPGSIRIEDFSRGNDYRRAKYLTQETSDKIIDYYRKKLKRIKGKSNGAKISSGISELSGFSLNGIHIVPAREDWMLLDGGSTYDISISIQESYAANNIRVIQSMNAYTIIKL